MARRKRFKPDPDFQVIVSRAVVGGGRGAVRGRTRGSVRRRRSTLVEIAEDIIEAARDITESEAGIPSVSRGGRRAPGYDFRTEDRKGRTYWASFRATVERHRGRLSVVVVNDHYHAQEVEFGNGPGVKRARGDGYMRIPISMKAYSKIKAGQAANRKPLTEFQKQRARAKSRLRYWEGRRDGGDARSRRNLNLMERRARAGKKTRLSRGQIDRIRFDASLGKRRAHGGARGARLDVHRRRMRVRDEIALAQRVVEITGMGTQKSRSFAAIGRNGKPYLFTKEVKTYRGYGILRRAMRRATLKLE